MKATVKDKDGKRYSVSATELNQMIVQQLLFWKEPSLEKLIKIWDLTQSD
jgi:hypothetical protein